MISKLFRKRSSNRTLAASVPDGERIYAVGDIHGRLDLLDELLADIERDISLRGEANHQIIFLGDLIDRGPQSAQVVDRAIRLRQSGVNCRFLLGNHEEVFLTAMKGDEKALAFFNRIGGRETILSYGVSETEYREADYSQLLELLHERVPSDHIEFLENFENMIIMGDYVFVHAGVRPDRPLSNQRLSDLRWIRDDFLTFDGVLERVVVHGHTISDEVVSLPHRIGLDTGAYATGRLTAMGFEGGDRWLIQTGG